MFWRGWDGYEPEMTPLFWRLATAARVTLDVGAHVGFHAILAAIANDRGSVFAFEPLPQVFERLQRNLALNRLQNVTAVPQAAGATDGWAPFFHVPGLIPCSSSLSEAFMRGTSGLETVMVPVVRLDTFARTHRVTAIDLIKLDTETTEPDVLAGMGELLPRSRPDIFCEVQPRGDADALTGILASARLFVLSPDRCRPEASAPGDRGRAMAEPNVHDPRQFGGRPSGRYRWSFVSLT